MSRTLPRYNRLLKPLAQEPTQVYLGTEVHLVGLLSWILDQTGPAEVFVTTFSTSDDFLCGFKRLRDDGLISHSVLLADFKASNKTIQLGALMRSAFDEVFFSENHSKLMLVKGGGLTVTVVTSQNQTYGGRVECTMISSDCATWLKLHDCLKAIIDNKSVTYKEWMH
ncbi:MAG: C4-dicarboxylate ABC transporter [Prevotella sp.]|nr:C4-dicarboxylate ABC transporter [Candidatus Prevotella equi]